jgi:hypothetical protein
MAGIPYSMNDRIVEEGEVGFLGMASRINPVILPPGIVQLARNMRFDRGVARTRLGAERAGDDIPVTIPLALPFTLAPDITLATITHSATTATATATAHGFTNGQQVNISGADQVEYNGDFFITVTGVDTFTYTMSGNPGENATGTFLANAGPVLQNTYDTGFFAGFNFSDPGTGRERILIFTVSNAFVIEDDNLIATIAYPTGPDETITADYTLDIVQAFDRIYLYRGYDFPSKAVSSITQTSGTATVTCTAHGFTTGQRVRISGADQLSYIVDHDITVVDANSFTITVPTDTVTPATGSALRVRRVLPPLMWDGIAVAFARTTAGVHPLGPSFLRMPAAGFATYFNNILAVPMDTDGVVLSDFLDPDTFDPMLKSFRANSGSADYIVAIHPWIDRQLLIFKRKSIYIAQIGITEAGDGIDPATSQIVLLTDEVGCMARQSIVTAGTSVFFLSDAGVYRLNSQLDLRLRGDTRPLSDAIENILARIDPATAHLAQAVYWRNRYYLNAKFLDENDASYEGILIYNTINEQWESLDTYFPPLGSLFVGRWKGDYRMLIVSRTGRLIVLEELEEGDRQIAGPGIDPIPGYVLTRRYTHGSLSNKRILRCRINAQLPGDSTLHVNARITDPDAAAPLGSITNAHAPNDYSIKLPIRRPGHFVELELTTSAGRPELRQLMVDAALKQTNTSNLTKE